jgi:hypothetical protein
VALGAAWSAARAEGSKAMQRTAEAKRKRIKRKTLRYVEYMTQARFAKTKE